MPDDIKSLTQRQFAAHADAYVTAQVHASGYSLNRVIELLDPGPNWRVLDVATGGGHTALAVAQRGAWTVSSDLTHAMLLAARKNHAASGQPQIVHARLDAEHLPFAAGRFDAVTCRVAPHHFPDVAQFVREAARVTRPGGVVAVIDQLSPGEPKAARYVNAFERLRDPSHNWAYSEVEWKGFFTGADLTVEHYEDFDTHHALVPWAERMGCNPATIQRLHAMLAQTPPPVAAWMKPALPAGGEASFVIRQFLMIGRKG
ncbi:class I SAM-dependent methyltransferase [Aggregatilinea lenta]|uniref:class I SAM-dependent methyltransferase n=1 Tax=Aggregatilinea lenta TaxID=913108 RepID=UPI000E5AAC2F|nr:methyltransferase domain-containing protein [Aggregatilinea lenta]